MQNKSSQRAVLARLVIGTSRTWRRAVDQGLEKRGFSEATALPLLVLLHSEHVRRQSEIADILHLERPALVRIIDLLAAEGCIDRKEDPADRRAKILTLTPKGRVKAVEIEGIVDGLRKKILSGITDADLLVTVRTLQAVEKNLRALRQEGVQGE